MKTELEKIKERNKRVEADKAWETSLFRKVSIAIMTYVVAVLAFWSIGNDQVWRNALIPTIGFILSVQSLPFLKTRWIKKHISKQK